MCGTGSTHLLYMLPSYGCIFVASCAVHCDPTPFSAWPADYAHGWKMARTCKMLTALSASPSTLIARARLW